MFWPRRLHDGGNLGRNGLGTSALDERLEATSSDEDTPSGGRRAIWMPLLLSGRVHKYVFWPDTWPQHRPAVDEVAALYDAHADEIEAAAREATAGRFVSYARAILAKADQIDRESKQEDA